MAGYQDNPQKRRAMAKAHQRVESAAKARRAVRMQWDHFQGLVAAAGSRTGRQVDKFGKTIQHFETRKTQEGDVELLTAWDDATAHGTRRLSTKYSMEEQLEWLAKFSKIKAGLEEFEPVEDGFTERRDNYDESTITLQELAEQFKTLKRDLKRAGWI